MVNTVNYNKELNELHEDIASKTLNNHRETMEVIATQLNSIYALLCTIESPMNDVLPVRDKERASKFLVILYSISAFHFGSTIFKLSINGQYPEAGALIRSLIESVSFAEYYHQKPNEAFKIASDVESLPKRKSVFKYLKYSGQYPKGGPRVSFEKYNPHAHGNIESVTSHWAYSEDKTSTSHIWLRRYNPESFKMITKDIFIPLLGIQEIFRKSYIDEDKYTHEDAWRITWEASHNREKINRVFPSIVIGKEEDA